MSKSGIYIKPSKRGTFTAAAKKRGMGVQSFASKVLANKENYSSAMVKKANFARNAAKWKHEDGGTLLEFPEYAVGGWLGDNAGGLLKGAGAVAQGFPPIGTIVGTVLGVAGTVVDKQKEKKQVEEAAEAENLAARRQALAQRHESDVMYTPMMEYGGELLDTSQMSRLPMINQYSSKADTHEDGIGGIPVDSKGNPSTVSRQSAVGLTEAGEVTWNGYVFSNKLKLK